MYGNLEKLKVATVVLGTLLALAALADPEVLRLLAESPLR